MIRFTAATPTDDPDLRRLLRDNAMTSWVDMAVEREPSFFAGSNRFGRDHPVIARDGARAAGMFVLSEHPVHVNGQPVRAGYLGALRVAPGYRKHVRALRDGYAAAFAAGGIDRTAPRYTCIASQNRAARRVLEAGLAGLPRYEAAGDIVALALPKARGRHLGLWQRMRPDETDAVCALHNQAAAARQFSPVLDETVIAATGADFHVCRDAAGQVTACMALWSQSAYKQVVARGYRQPLRALRPFYNLAAACCRRVTLPRPGGRVDQTYLAFLAADPVGAPSLTGLVRDALALCDSAILTVGFAADDPAQRMLAACLRPSVYAMTIYTVSFGEPPVLDQRPVLPEIAVL